MSDFIKNFVGWFKLKPKLEEYKKRPLFQEREVWMCHIGTNIGYEIDGKSIDVLRPVIVFKKLSANTFLAIPLSHTTKSGSWYSPSYVNNQSGVYCLNQIRMVDSKRLKYLIERVDENNFTKLKSDFQKMLNH